MTANPQPGNRAGRPLILCFDGTANGWFSGTNVGQLSSYLAKNNEGQGYYYQPGIGTYIPHDNPFSKMFKRVSTKLDMALAWYIGDHILGGYKYLMNTYRPGDRICLFGFSRGAYTARCLASMISVVGLVPAGNEESALEAFRAYKKRHKLGPAAIRDFRSRYGSTPPVTVEFLGVWDTVASIGMGGQALPYVTQDGLFRFARHALALDERRTRFQHTPLPLVPSINNQQNPPDYKEVWFVGSHSDVGGKQRPMGSRHDLGDPSLLWMIQQIDKAGVQIIWDPSAFGPAAVSEYFSQKLSQTPDWTTVEANLKIDIRCPVHDDLSSPSPWWMLEYVPHQKQNLNSGTWRMRFNRGRRRKITDGNSLFHCTVRWRNEFDPKYHLHPHASDPLFTEPHF